MLICGLDIETTGFLDTGDHRIIEVYAGLWDMDSLRLVDEFYRKVHPQRSIPVDSFRVHGIALGDLEGAPPFEGIADELQAFLERAQLLVAHNGETFDLPFINQELKRVGREIVRVPMFDTMKQARWATADGKSPTLGQLCFALGIDYDAAKAHAASYDVKVMMAAFFQSLGWGWFKLESDRAA